MVGLCLCVLDVPTSCHFIVIICALIDALTIYARARTHQPLVFDTNNSHIRITKVYLFRVYRTNSTQFTFNFHSFHCFIYILSSVILRLLRKRFANAKHKRKHARARTRRKCFTMNAFSKKPKQNKAKQKIGKRKNNTIEFIRLRIEIYTYSIIFFFSSKLIANESKLHMNATVSRYAIVY